MSFTYVCARGHAQGVWQDWERAQARAAGKDRELVRCECGLRRKLTQQTVRRFGFQFIPDVPEHFNDSLGAPVRGRRHLRQLQEQHGLMDKDALAHPSSSWTTEPERAGKIAEKAAATGKKRMEEAAQRGEEWARDDVPAVEVEP